jgi:hypothetical protein
MQNGGPSAAVPEEKCCEAPRDEEGGREEEKSRLGIASVTAGPDDFAAAKPESLPPANGVKSMRDGSSEKASSS